MTSTGSARQPSEVIGNDGAQVVGFAPGWDIRDADIEVTRSIDGIERRFDAVVFCNESDFCTFRAFNVEMQGHGHPGKGSPIVEISASLQFACGKGDAAHA